MSSFKNQPPFMSIQQISDILGVTYNTAYRWVVQDSKLKGVRLGNKVWRIPKESVEEFIKAGVQSDN